MEVEDLKHHLATSNLNVSADVIEKAIVFPEDEFEGVVEPPLARGQPIEKRTYPKVLELLQVNPFAKPKKGKKGKGKKKK